MNKPAQVVAIQYGEHTVPKVVAKGREELARKIIAAAMDNNVPVCKDEDLVQLLGLLELDESIPPVLYTLVAEVLVYVYWLKGMKPGDEKTSNTHSPSERV